MARTLLFPLRGLVCRLRGGRQWRTSQVQSRVLELIRNELAKLSPEEGLQFLFRLDDRLYHIQGATAVEYGGGLHPKHRHLKYHDFFVDRISQGERVLDVGCGIGAVSLDIAKRSQARVVAIDIEAANVETARTLHAHPDIEYHVADVMGQSPTGPFDVVVMSNVLEHLPDRIALLGRLAKTMAASRFLIRVPCFERDWRVPLKKEIGVEWRLDDTHETEYTLNEFRAEMDGAGLDIQYLQICWGEILAELSVRTA